MKAICCNCSYAYSGRPVIVKDALANWTAVDVFSYEFFSELYTKESNALASRSQRCQFFPYKTEFRSLEEALTMSEDRQSNQPWYFGWSNCDSQTADVLRRHYSRPYFLPERSESSRTDWIFMGTAGLGAHMHVRVSNRLLCKCSSRSRFNLMLNRYSRLVLGTKVDHVSLPSWQAQCRGKKVWSLEPPPECHYQCQSMEVTVEAGDTSNKCYSIILFKIRTSFLNEIFTPVVLDTNIWYHKTNVVSEEVSITIGSEYD